MDKKNISIVVAIVLGIGLVLTIFLSFHVVKDTKSIANLSTNTSLQEQTPEKPSIYNLDIPVTKKREIRVMPQEDKEKSKIVTKIPKDNIKTLEQEQAELAAGIQQDYNSSSVINKTSTPSVFDSDTSQTSTPATDKYETLNPTDKDVQDLHKRGIVIF